MMTREEQITKLEEAFNVNLRRVYELSTAEQLPSSDSVRNRILALQAVTEALTYLRTVIPNPQGRVDPIAPRRRNLDL